MGSKKVYIIAGPNGAGKTTFAREFLPEYAQCPHFINADLIAQGLSPFSPQQVAIKSGKLVLERIKEFSSKGVDFGFETTLAGKLYLKHFLALKERSYQLHLFFLWIPGSQLAIARIKDRVAEGGHHVPSEDVRRRFARSIFNFLKIYRPVVDSWMMFNNSAIKPELIATSTQRGITVVDDKLFEKILKQAGVAL